MALGGSSRSRGVSHSLSCVEPVLRAGTRAMRADADQEPRNPRLVQHPSSHLPLAPLQSWAMAMEEVEQIESRYEGPPLLRGRCPLNEYLFVYLRQEFVPEDFVSYERTSSIS
jgi:hypothetical protein